MDRPRKEQSVINNAPSTAEEWRPAKHGLIPECIEVSNLGNIRSVGDTEVRIIPPDKCEFTQVMIIYKKNGKNRAFTGDLYTIIGETFLTVGNSQTVAHITTDYTDDSVKNLAVLTVAERNQLLYMRHIIQGRRNMNLDPLQENITLSGTTFKL